MKLVSFMSFSPLLVLSLTWTVLLGKSERGAFEAVADDKTNLLLRGAAADSSSSSASSSSVATEATRTAMAADSLLPRRKLQKKENTIQQLLQKIVKPMQSIIGGVITMGQEFPFFVQSDSRQSGYLCGGSLVARDMVLTAAHCIRSFNSSRVLVGSFERNNVSGSLAQWRNITSPFVRHPSFDSETYQYDFALFRIEPVSLPNLVPIALNTDPLKDPAPGQDLTTIGYGRISISGKSSQALYKVFVQAVDHDTCNSPSSYDGQIDPVTMLCASSPGKDSCNGDSGGPIFTDNGSSSSSSSNNNVRVLVGVTSWGDECASPIYPGVYAKVTGASDWIHSTICQLTRTNPVPAFCHTNTPTKAPTTPPPSLPPTNTPPPTQTPTQMPTTKAPITPMPTQLPTQMPTTKALTTPVPTQAPTQMPTTKAPTTPAPTSSATYYSYRVDVQYDGRPTEFFWDIRRATTNAVVIRYNQGNVTTSYRFLSVDNIPLMPGLSYRVVAKDVSGDGLTMGINGSLQLFRKKTSMINGRNHTSGNWTRLVRINGRYTKKTAVITAL